MIASSGGAYGVDQLGLGHRHWAPHGIAFEYIRRRTSVNSDFGHLRAKRMGTGMRTGQNERRLASPNGQGLGLLTAAATVLFSIACSRTSAPAAPALPYPKIDVHTHVSASHAAQAVNLFRENGIDVAVNASGGLLGQGLATSRDLAASTGGRLLYYCNVDFAEADAADWPQRAIQMVDDCKRLGARGVKIFKALGLGYRTSDGNLLAVDDPRLDILFERAGALGLPVLIHSGDPVAFFTPPTRENERFEELQAQPGWSFFGESAPGRPWPSWDELFAQYERRVARHPHTTFIGAHFGNAAEYPQRVAQMFARYPNLVIDTAARVPEFGRHPASEMRAFFIRWQDRILFGSDTGIDEEGLSLGSHGRERDRAERLPAFFAAHWRYFETDTRRMATPTPIQGRWTIDGIHLPAAVLRKIYAQNAMRILHIQLPATNPH